MTGEISTYGNAENESVKISSRHVVIDELDFPMNCSRDKSPKQGDGHSLTLLSTVVTTRVEKRVCYYLFIKSLCPLSPKNQNHKQTKVSVSDLLEGKQNNSDKNLVG